MIKKLISNSSENNIGKLTSLPLSFYSRMLNAGVKPNGHTFTYLIKALVGQGVTGGEVVHASVIRNGFELNQFVSSSLLGFYTHCGFVDRGRQVFDEMLQPGLVVWTSMIKAYVSTKDPLKALEMFDMMRKASVMPDSIALAIILSACALMGDLNISKAVHGFTIKSPIEIDEYIDSGFIAMYGACNCFDLCYQFFLEIPQKNTVMWNTMIHQCVEHENLNLAHQLFESMPKRDAVSWNTMLGGFCRVGQYKEALALFNEMERSIDRPNKTTLSVTLFACASVGALDIGTWIHAYIEKNNMNFDGSLDSSLIDMYAKCGNIDKAVLIFENSAKQDIYVWTSIICALALHGLGNKALRFFYEMKDSGIQPDDVAYIGVLNACSHCGLLDEGWRVFNSIRKPTIEHYGCVIDLLGRMGCLREAYDLLKDMPMDANEVIWGTLLSACRVHNNVELGEVATSRLIALEPSNPWAQVMISNIYAKESRWDVVMRIRKEMKERCFKKSPGCSSTEVNGEVHEFVVGENSLHPCHREIQLMLETIENVLRL